jgi:hypothetical protein
MMLLPLLVTVQLVILHFPDGYPVTINPAHVVSLRETSEQSGHENRLLVRGAHCVIGLTTGKFIAVTESCRDVQRLLEAR